MKNTAAASSLVKRLWLNADPISKWVQVLALLVAAYWTYTTFSLGEAPALKTNAIVDGTLKDENIEGDAGCYIEFDVSVENIGKTAFDVSGIQLRVWRTEIPKPPANSAAPDKPATDMPKYFDVDLIQENPPVFEKFIRQGNLVRRYLPQNASKQTFTWTMNRAPSQFVYLFRADALVGDKPLDYGRQWRDDLCIPKKEVRDGWRTQRNR